jgi:hypothetical protein
MIENSSNNLLNRGSGDEPKYSLLILGLFAVITALYYLFLIYYWRSITKIFTLFENSTYILTIYYTKIVNLFYNPNFTEIAVVIAFVFGILYIILTIEYRGHMIFSQDRKSIHEQTALASFFVLAMFNAFFLIPYCYFLWVEMNRPLEVFINLLMFVSSVIFGLFFIDFGNMMQDYKRLDNFCKGIRPHQLILPFNRRDGLIILIMNKQRGRNLIALLMIVSVIFTYFRNFNLLTLVYIELVLSFWMFTILMLTFPYGPVKGPVNIFLNSGQVFNRVFIIEESELGYILTLHEGNTLKKVMTNSIDFIEPYYTPGSEYQ